MSATTDTVRARIDKDTKEKATKNLKSMGLSVSEAIRLLMVQVANEAKLPFEMKVPNKVTKQAMKELEAGKGNRADSVDELMAGLNEED